MDKVAMRQAGAHGFGQAGLALELVRRALPVRAAEAILVGGEMVSVHALGGNAFVAVGTAAGDCSRFFACDAQGRDLTPPPARTSDLGSRLTTRKAVAQALKAA